MNRMRHLPLATALIFCGTAYAQNIGINTTGAAPAASAMLDVDATNKGMLIPRVALTAANVAGPVAAPATSLLVYNTATAGTYPNDVSPGYYYWTGTQWERLMSRKTRVLYYPPTNINGNTRYTLTGNFAGLTPTSFVAVSIIGNWPVAPTVVVEHIEAQTGQVRFVVYNRTNNNYSGMDFLILVIKP